MEGNQIRVTCGGRLKARCVSSKTENGQKIRLETHTHECNLYINAENLVYQIERVENEQSGHSAENKRERARSLNAP